METKKKNRIIDLISMTVIATVVFLWFSSNDKKEIIPEQSRAVTDLVLTKKHMKYVKKLSQAPTYDYQNLLSLLDKYRKIEVDFYADFNLFINDYLNLKSLKNTLKELKEERGVFKKYVKRMKKYHSRSAPSRRRDSLRYYFRVLEDDIDGIKKMIEHFNLHIKIQAKNHKQGN